ncbi:Na/Pi cotransporter family protein [Chitinimonas lacunae]|uniref:Na/Pi cotransporter family protein n=1 Tax=Chitinimonas lacunae TaxID=1963018 RepID=A0ABV8MN80_9NEIS
MPSFLTLLFSVLAAVMLFLYGLAAFSAEMARLGGQRLHNHLQWLTRADWRGALTGAAFTAVVQSSSAVTSIAVTLAHQGTVSYRAALSLMIGANVGTTLTAWLVALHIGGLGPVFVSLGGIWSLVGPPLWRPYGKAVFYFGLIFLALDLIGTALAPLGRDPALLRWYGLLGSPIIALLAGMLLTVVVQSSSVVSGLAVLLVSQSLVAPATAVWMVAGANVGTTSTALLASSALDNTARKLALLNTGFNLLGVVLFATLLRPLTASVLASSLDPTQQVALVHSLFNLTAALVSLFLLPACWPAISTWLERPSNRTLD